MTDVRMAPRPATVVAGTRPPPAQARITAGLSGHDRGTTMPHDDQTVRGERLSPTGPDVELIASERPRGMFSRQVILGDTLDTENIRASYHSGVLRLNIPVAERAKPRKISVAATEAKELAN